MELVWSILAVLGAAVASVGVVWLLGRWLMQEESARLPVLIPVWGDAQELSLQLTGVYWRQPFWRREQPQFWLLDLGLTDQGRRQVALMGQQWGELPLCRPEQLPGLLHALEPENAK